MTEKNTIHIRMDYNEALEGKKDILSSEINLLQIKKRIEKYKELRTQELRNKINIQKEIKKTRATFNKLQSLLPKVKIPKILSKGHESFLQEQEEVFVEKDYSLERELKEIERKLREIQK